MQRYIVAVCAYAIAGGCLAWAGGLWLVHTNIARLPHNSVAAAFFIPGISVADLQRKYNKTHKTNKEVRILLVPGHEPTAGGTQYQSAVERDMAVELAQELSDLLQNTERYDVTIARDKEAWNPLLLSYFKDNWDSIQTFMQQQKVEMATYVGKGSIVKREPALAHNTAPTDMAFRLYGIHKWANEHDIDVAIHIHFNDTPRKNRARPGPYTGFTVYIPDAQYSNAATARTLAESIFANLATTYHASTMPKEASGIVESQDLIGVGSYNTSNAPSILIEYAYIYEPMLQDPATRAQTLHTMAEQTFAGLQDFFENRR